MRIQPCVLWCCGFIVAGCAVASELDDTIKQLPAQDPQTRAALNAKLFADTPATVGALSAMLTEPGKGDDHKTRLALNTMAIAASRPGADAERKQYAQSAAKQLGGPLSAYSKIFLLTQLRLTADDAEVPEIGKLLTENELSEQAAQTLLTINTPAARDAVRTALPAAKGAPRAVLVIALGNLRDKAAAAEIMKDAQSPDAALRSAALNALANIGTAAVAPALKKAVDDAGMDKFYERSQATQAQITLAQRLAVNGDKDAAVALCRELLQTRTNPKEDFVRCAALNILTGVLGMGAFNDIEAALKSDSAEFRAAARELGVALKDDAATEKLAGELKGSGAPLRIELLEILKQRKDKNALREIVAALKDADENVRSAAASALVIGGDEALPALLEILKKDPKGNTAEQRSARVALTHLKGGGVNAGIAAAFKGAPLELRKTLIALLSERAAFDSLPLLAEAAKDADPAVRVAALEALGALGSAKLLPALFEAIDKAADDTERSAAEKAAAAIASRHEHGAASIAMITDAYKTAPEKGKQALLRVLGKIGGPEALTALKPSLSDPSAEVADTAVRELANWPDASALAIQLETARSAQSIPHHVLTISGYVRLLGTQSKRPQSELIPLYLGALQVCRRPDEKKKVISGLQGLKSVEALKALEPLLEDKDLKGEAASAYLHIAKEISKSNGQAAKDAYKKIIAGSASEQRKKDARSELEKLK